MYTMGSLSLLVATLFLIEVYAGIPVMSRVVEGENKALVQNQIAVPQDEWTKLEVGSEATTAPGKAPEAPQHLVARGEGAEAGAQLAPSLSKKRSWTKTFSFGRKSRSDSRSGSPSRSDTSSRAGSPARSDSLSRAGSTSGSDDGYSSDGSKPKLTRSTAFREGSKRYRSLKLDDVASPSRAKSPRTRRSSSRSG